MKLSTILSVQTLVSLGSAHTIMQAVNGNKQGVAINMPGDDSFISDVKSNSMACNGAPVTQFHSSSVVIPVTAGQNVTGAWLHTLSSTGPDQFADNKVIDSSHKGPVLTWMKKVDDATKNPSAGPGDGWFKINEAGLSNGRWAVDDLIAAGGIQTATIPSCIENGDYLLRFELIALHSASNLGEAQFYMECAQIRVSGGTAAAKPATVSIPGVYSATDPGIKVMIWNNVGKPYPSAYSIPGPRPFVCPVGGATPSKTATVAAIPTTKSMITSVIKPTTTAVVKPSSAATSAASSAVTSAVTSAAAAITTTSVRNRPTPIDDCADEPTKVPTSGAADVRLYGQCGGVGYTGATKCARGSCKVSNAWYSQCLL